MPSLIGRCGGGGGFQMASEYIDGGVHIAASGSGLLAFERVAGSVLLDFTTPTAPFPYESGFYSFTGTVRPDGAHVNVSFPILVVTYTSAPVTTLWSASGVHVAGEDSPYIPWAGVVELANPGGTFTGIVGNNDSVAHDFDVALTVVFLGKS